MKEVSVKPVRVKYIHAGAKCAIWHNGHLGNWNLAPYGAMVIKELNALYSTASMLSHISLLGKNFLTRNITMQR